MTMNNNDDEKCKNQLCDNESTQQQQTTMYVVQPDNKRLDKVKGLYNGGSDNNRGLQDNARSGEDE